MYLRVGSGANEARREGGDKRNDVEEAHKSKEDLFPHLESTIPGAAIVKQWTIAVGKQGC